MNTKNTSNLAGSLALLAAVQSFLVGTSHAAVTEYFDHAQYSSVASGISPTTLINFDSLPPGDGILTGNEFAGLGATIVQLDAQPINVVQPAGDYGFAVNFNSAPNGISSGFSVSGAPFSRSDNFEIQFAQNMRFAGLWIGNLGGSGGEDTTVQFLSSGGTVLSSEVLNRFHTGIIEIGTYQNRIFFGLVSDSSDISAIRVLNPVNGDSIVLDDISFGGAASGPGVPDSQGTGLLLGCATLGLVTLTMKGRRIPEGVANGNR